MQAQADAAAAAAEAAAAAKSASIVIVAVNHTCGDGIRGTAEACDDGNKVDGDGCSRKCIVESGFILITVIARDGGWGVNLYEL